MNKNNMSAKEMFEKLEYKLRYENMNYMTYIDSFGRIIKFDKVEYRIEKYIEDDYGNKQQIGWLKNKELQAINKQIEELGWNNE